MFMLRALRFRVYGCGVLLQDSLAQKRHRLARHARSLPAFLARWVMVEVWTLEADRGPRC